MQVSIAPIEHFASKIQQRCGHVVTKVESLDGTYSYIQTDRPVLNQPKENKWFARRNQRRADLWIGRLHPLETHNYYIKNLLRDGNCIVRMSLYRESKAAAWDEEMPYELGAFNVDVADDAVSLDFKITVYIRKPNTETFTPYATLRYVGMPVDLRSVIKNDNPKHTGCYMFGLSMDGRSYEQHEYFAAEGRTVLDIPFMNLAEFQFPESQLFDKILVPHQTFTAAIYREMPVLARIKDENWKIPQPYFCDFVEYVIVSTFWCLDDFRRKLAQTKYVTKTGVYALY